jgi:hypothetical protein
MGRQITFRMEEDDLARFVSKLENDGVLLLPYRHRGPEIERLMRIGDRREGLVWLVRPSDADFVRLRHVATQGYWVVDQIRSPVVEFSPGGASGEGLKPGRLHFNAGYFDDDGNRVDFPTGFVEWADGLLAWIRKSFRRNSANGIYEGPGVQKGKGGR